MFDGKTVEKMEALQNESGKVTGYSILFTDGIEVVIDDKLDLYSKDNVSQRFGWVHPHNIGK
jgi:hypothetical protein